MRKCRMLAIILSCIMIIGLAGCADNSGEDEKQVSVKADETEISGSIENDDASAGNAAEKAGDATEPSGQESGEESTTAAAYDKEEPIDKPVSPQPTKPRPQEQEERPPQTSAATPLSRPSAGEVAEKTAEKINALRLQQGSPPATILPGLTKVATLRSEQLITNFSHESDPDACTLLQYGEFVDMTEYGMPESSYYRGYSREAAAKGTWTGTADEIAENIANGFRNSSGHWSYVGSSEYSYMAVGVTYNADNSTWYCCVCMSSKNYGG